MAATVLGITTLTFGAPTVSGLVVQNVSFDESVNITEVQDEDGDYVSAALSGSKTTGTIEAVENGNTTAMGATLAVTGAPTGTFHVTARGVRFGNTEFKRKTLGLTAWGGIS